MDLLGGFAQQKKATLLRSHSPGCLRETVDCADPRHDQAASTRRKHRSRQRGTFARRSPRTGDRGLKDRGARRPVPRRAAKNGGPLSSEHEQGRNYASWALTSLKYVHLCQRVFKCDLVALTLVYDQREALLRWRRHILGCCGYPEGERSATVGLPLMVAVPLPLSWNVTPAGRDPIGE